MTLREMNSKEIEIIAVMMAREFKMNDHFCRLFYVSISMCPTFDRLSQFGNLPGSSRRKNRHFFQIIFARPPKIKSAH